MKSILYFLSVGLFIGIWSCSTNTTDANTSVSAEAPSFEVILPKELTDQALDGRLILMLSKDDSKEPRFQISDGPGTQLAFGMNVENWQAGSKLTFKSDTPGYPLTTLADVPPGDYQVQILLHKYETFERSDGHTVKLPMDRGEGQQWNKAPGNLINAPQKLNIQAGQIYELAFNHLFSMN